MCYLCKVKTLVRNMREKIKHPGVVCFVGEGCVDVRIVQTSACSSCKVASRCNSAESKMKTVRVNVNDASAYAVGDTVVVGANHAVGLRASLYAYLLPLLLMVSMLVAVILLTGSEGAAALSAIGVLLPYYLLLWLLSGKMGRSLRFEIVGRGGEEQ